jgi:pSer/pThr/pTyr-binding forkhead associated (FHA) protein
LVRIPLRGIRVLTVSAWRQSGHGGFVSFQQRVLRPMEVKIIMFSENGERRDFVLSEGATTIGRKTDCDIRIPLPDISRRHAEIFLDEDGAVLKDLGAANGTFLNNRRITEEDLEPGDQLVIGPVVFTVQIDGEPGDDEIIQVRTKIRTHQTAGGSGSGIATSQRVEASPEDSDPISALEALASSSDQTAINPEDEEDLLSRPDSS